MLTRGIFVLLAMLMATAAEAAAVSELIGERLRDRVGAPAGKVSELILDVRAGRVLYVIVEQGERYVTLPVRALDERLRLDMDAAGEAARLDEQADPRFRRAGKLLGQQVEHTDSGELIGKVRDIEFDPKSGRIEHVVLDTDAGARNFPPGVLAHGRFPPLTRWQAEHPSPEAPERGFTPRPSDERRSLHDPRWERN